MIVSLSPFQLLFAALVCLAFAALFFGLGWIARGDRKPKPIPIAVRPAREPSFEELFGPRHFNVVRIRDWKAKGERGGGLFGGQSRGVA